MTNRIPSQDELQKSVDGFRWYHEITVSPYIKTKPVQRFDVSWDLIGQGMDNMNLKGKSVLDVGTRDGKYAFLAEQNGAATVVAIDNDLSRGALWLKRHWNSSVDFQLENVYGVPLFRYDVVFLFGVLYHLRYPMDALNRLSNCLADHGKLYIETALFVGGDCEALPMLHCPVRKSPYEQTSCSFFNLPGLTETLWSFGCTVKSHKFHPSEDRPTSSIMTVRRAWVEAEKTHDMPEDLRRYWESTHTSHD